MAAAIPMVGSSMSVEHNPGKAGMSVSVKGFRTLAKHGRELAHDGRHRKNLNVSGPTAASGLALMPAIRIMAAT